MNKYILTKSEYDALFDDNTTVVKYHRIEDKVSMRISEILKTLLGSDFKWFDYANGDYEAEGATGVFDPQRYKEFIELHGEFNLKETDVTCGCCCSGIPTKWLYEDNYKDQYATAIGIADQERQIKKDKEAIKRKVRKEKLAALEKSIRSKLTSDELKAISFKK